MKSNLEESPENPHKSYYLYSNCQKKYLEIIYFQFLRNNKNETFSKYNLMSFLDISEYLCTKIFQVFDSKKIQHLSLEDFVNGISLFYSKYFPENWKNLTNFIFYLISDKA